MAKWSDIKKNITTVANKAVQKTEELTDTANFKLKISNKESDKNAQYKILGALTYEKLKTTNDDTREDLTLKIAQSIQALDTITNDLETLKAEYEEFCAKKKQNTQENIQENEQ